MLRTLICIFLLAVFAHANAQQFWQIDKRSAGIDAVMPDELAKKLTAPYKTDLEKFRAIFTWITSHIDYKLPSRSWSKTQTRSRQNTDTTWESRSLDERVAYNVMKNRAAVCEGYARLLKTLCDYAGISCNVISGYARSGEKSDKIFCTNHTWNAVYIDTAWRLADVTWASGGVSYAGEFIRKYDEFYFLTTPKDFIADHYPEDPKWTLLDKAPVLSDYDHAPFRLKAFKLNRFVGYAPANGTFHAAVGDTVKIKLTLGDIDHFHQSVSSVASLSFMPQPGEAYIQPSLLTNKEVHYNYIVRPGVEWINIVFREDVVIRYRVQIKSRN